MTTDHRALLVGGLCRALEVSGFVLAVVIGVRFAMRGQMWGWNGGDNGIAWFCMAAFFGAGIIERLVKAKRSRS